MTESAFAGVAAADVMWVEGTDRVDLLQRLSTQDLRPLHEAGNARGTVFTNEKGRIVDWCELIATPEGLLTVTSPGRGEKLQAWVDKFTIMEDVSTRLASDWRVVVASGPEAFAHAAGELPAEGKAIAARGGWWRRGLAAYGPRVEAVLPVAEAEAWASELAAKGYAPLTPEVENTLRVLAGVPSPLFEFEDEVNPLELRLKVAVSWNKGCYVGQEVISRMDSYDKVARFLMGFEAVGAALPAEPTGRLVRAGKTAGRVTSVARDGRGGVAGLAVVQREAATAAANDVTWTWDGGEVAVRLVDRPFWQG